MSTIGRAPARSVVSAEDIADNSINASKVVNGSIGGGDLSSTLALGSGTVFPAGHMIGVAQVLYKGADADNTPNQWKDYPGDIGNGSLSITPKATNSKFLVTWHLSVMRIQDEYSVHLRLNRKIGSGSWDDTICIGDTEGIRTRSTFSIRSPHNETTAFAETSSGTFLDTPTLSDLSTVYYKFTYNNAPSTGHTKNTYFGRNSSDWNDTGSGARIVQSLTVQEIAG